MSLKVTKINSGPGKVPPTPKKQFSDSDSFDSSPENLSVLGGGSSSPDLSPSDFDPNKSNSKQTTACKSDPSPQVSQPFNPLTTIPTNAELLEFANRPVPLDKLFQCTIIRDKRGLDQSFYPTYFMYLQAVISRNSNYTHTENRKSDTPANERGKLDEKPSSPITEAVKNALSIGSKSSGVTQPHWNSITSGTRQVFLMCGRRRKKSRYYLICLDPFDISKGNSIGKLKYNLIGTQFTSYKLVNLS